MAITPDPLVLSVAHVPVTVDPDSAPVDHAIGGAVPAAPIVHLLGMVPLNERHTSRSHTIEPFSRAHRPVTAVREHPGAVRVESCDEVAVVQDVNTLTSSQFDNGIVDQRPTLPVAEHLLSLGVGTGEPACIPAAHFVLLGRWEPIRSARWDKSTGYPRHCQRLR